MSDTGTTFSNEVVDDAALPRIDDTRFAALDPMFLRLRTVTSVGLATLALVATAVVALLGARGSVIALVGAGAALTVAFAVAHVATARSMGYLVREHDVSFRSGVVGRSVATVPFARVQHVAMRRGPFDRRLGLASLQVRTAGGFLAVPGLRVETAARLKELVAERAGTLAELEREAERSGPTTVPADGGDAAS